jgi:glycosyltransferase involved in cell wall biosynthesis
MERRQGCEETMSEPLVSVIVPTIGRPVFFQKALASVAAQTYPNLEIFVSDNAAEPPISLEEVRVACGGRRVRFVRRESRLSFADHFNTCLRDASGEFAMFLSDDDLLVPRFVENAVECIASDPDIGAVMSRQTRIDETFLGSAPDESIRWDVVAAEDLYQRWFRDCRMDGVLTFVSLLGRREAMVRQGGFGVYPSGAHSDIDLLLSLTLGRRVGMLTGGFLYRVYASSVGLGMPWKHLWDGTRSFERRLDLWRREGRLSPLLHRALLRSHSSMMLGRYRTLYRNRAGAVNKVRPVLDIAGRLIVNLVRHGPVASPVLHRFGNHWPRSRPPEK